MNPWLVAMVLISGRPWSGSRRSSAVSVCSMGSGYLMKPGGVAVIAVLALVGLLLLLAGTGRRVLSI